jgi:hypothetical protein
MKMFDHTKKYTLRDGREWRYAGAGNYPGHPIVGQYKNEFGWWTTSTWAEGGEFGIVADWDLVQVKTTRAAERWINVYAGQSIHDRLDSPHARNEEIAKNISIACEAPKQIKLTITWEE